MIALLALLLPAQELTPAPQYRLQWSEAWTRPGLPDLFTAGGLFASAGAIRLLQPEPPRGFRGSVILDDQLRDLLRIEDESTRNAVSDLSDGLQIALAAAPFAESGLLFAMGDADPRLLEAMTIINLQSNAVTLAAVALTKSLVGRVRPQGPSCENVPEGETCGSDANRSSFVSGHAAAAFTGASLVCLHHAHFQHYENAAVEAMACPATLALATVTSILRVSVDKHFASDVWVGAAIGVVSGFALPSLVYYSEDAGSEEDESRLHGALQVSALTGLLGEEGLLGFAAGGHLSVDKIWHLSGDRWPAIQTRADGRLVRTSNDFRWAQGELTARFWYNGLALGFAADYRDRYGKGGGLTGGPSLAIGLFSGRDMAITLSGRWAPLFQGSDHLYAARLEAAFLTWLALSAEVINFDPDGEMFLAGAGGRLPW